MPGTPTKREDGDNLLPEDTTMIRVTEAQVPNMSFQEYEDKGQRSTTNAEYKDQGRFEQGNGH
ncbi:hypothetical protein EYF80_044209 [Liparis tanakae]|uniref:Uncharacterized protein n=1 Tax=Liparis tanakae TaxID=230148 RepID=A0A4Z2FXI4_9TELE|nr:hypothetical protein EYF80_044209 [Liparis tanakae]